MVTSRRLFAALPIPPACRSALLELNPHLPGLRWLPESQLHLTLSFLGDVAAPAMERLRDSLGTVKVPPFLLPLRGTGAFYARGRPSVVWVGVATGHPHLFLLHRRVQDAVLHAGLEPDLKPFHPHVTVARGAGITRQDLKPFLQAHTEADLGLFKVAGFELCSSILSAEGAAHHVEAHWEF